MNVLRPLLAAFALFATGALVAYAQPSTNYCQYGTQSSLFLLDRTTPYDPTDEQAIVESVSNIIAHLRPGDRLVVATIGAHYTTSQRAFNECMPGCPATNGLDGLLSTCRPMIARRDLQSFRSRLVSAVRPLIRSSASADASDITGTVSTATRNPAGGRAYTNVYIYSDMLENSQALPWRDFSRDPARSMAVVRSSNLTPSVRGANIVIAGMGRMHDANRTPLPAALDRQVREFWSGYFSSGGGRPRFVTVIE